MLLRLATATARADDDAGLAQLRRELRPRIGAGPLGDMFRLLTAEPVSTTADIKRSQAGNEPGGVVAGGPEGAWTGRNHADRDRRLIFSRWGLCGFVAAEGKIEACAHSANGHVPPPWPQGTVGAFSRVLSNRPSTGRKGYAMNALSPLGMVSELPSSNQMQSDAERTVVIIRRGSPEGLFRREGWCEVRRHAFAGGSLGRIQSMRSGSYRPGAAGSRGSRGRDHSARAFSPFLAEWRGEWRAGAGGKPYLHPHVAGAGFCRDRHLHVRRMRPV